MRTTARRHTLVTGMATATVLALAACGSSSSAGTGATSGNRAFDEYKAETLRRMEEEQKEFGSFLERLRFAKDKAEFDAFMAERRARPPAPQTDEKPAG